MSRRLSNLEHSRSYFGGRNPGEVSHSLMREAISACRALRINSSRSIPRWERFGLLSETPRFLR